VERTVPEVALDRTGPVPLYHQVATRLQQLIEQGELPVGSRLENEVELAERLGVFDPPCAGPSPTSSSAACWSAAGGGHADRAPRQLGEHRGAPVLTMVRTAGDEAGRAVEYGSHVYRASRYSFELTLTS